MGTMKFPSQKFKGINKIIFITDETMRLKELTTYLVDRRGILTQNFNPDPNASDLSTTGSISLKSSADGLRYRWGINQSELWVRQTGATPQLHYLLTL